MLSTLSEAVAGLSPIVKVILLQSLLALDNTTLTPPTANPNQDEKGKFHRGNKAEAVPGFLLYGGYALKVSMPLGPRYAIDSSFVPDGTVRSYDCRNSTDHGSQLSVTADVYP